MRKLFFIILSCITYLYSSQKVVILDGGIGGLTSSIYLSAVSMIMEGNKGSSIAKSLKVENRSSQIKITGENYITNISSLKQFNMEMKNADIPICLDFYSPRCFPCRRIEPIINDFAEKFSKKIKILKINISDFHKLAEKYQIRSIPTLVIIDDNEQIKKSGTKEIIDFLKDLEEKYQK